MNKKIEFVKITVDNLQFCGIISIMAENLKIFTSLVLILGFLQIILSHIRRNSQ